MNIITFFLKDYKIQLITIFVLALLAAFLESGTIAAIYPILNAVFSPEAGESNIILTIFQTLADWFPVSDLFISYCSVFIIFIVLTFIVKYFSIAFRTRFISHLVQDKQEKIYDKVIQADYQYFVEHKQGDLIYAIQTAPIQLANLISSSAELLSQAILSISVLLLLYSLSWVGATGVLVLGVAYIFLSRYLGKRISYSTSANEVEATQASNVIINESISGIKQIKAFAVVKTWIDQFNEATYKRWVNQIRRMIWQQVLPNILLLVLYLGVALVILSIKLVNPAGYQDLIPVFGAFAFAVFRLIPFVNTIGNIVMTLQAALPDCEIMYRMLSTDINQVIDGEKDLEKFTSDISFNTVSFAYQEQSETIKNISLSFEKDKTYGIVGRSGSGKTTIINLLLRLYDVGSGEIRIDGVDIREYRLESWLKKVGYVSQDTFILNDTVEKNITFGIDDYSREDVIKAAEYADAHAFISELSEGYDTIVGDKGMRLSGGQAQRIAVARAMIKNPEILIFDEATNNLDNISELAVQKAIEEISKDHTVILVAHRLSTIENADEIIVIEKGQIQEQGSHEELIRAQGSYWKLTQRNNG